MKSVTSFDERPVVQYIALFDVLAQRLLRVASENLCHELSHSWRTATKVQGVPRSIWTYVGRYVLRLDYYKDTRYNAYLVDLTDSDELEIMRKTAKPSCFLPPRNWEEADNALLLEYGPWLQELCLLAVKTWAQVISTPVILRGPSDQVRALAGARWYDGNVLGAAVSAETDLVVEFPPSRAFSVIEWRDEVANGGTRLGYDDWVDRRLESLRNECTG